MCKSRLGRARWVSLKDISALLLLHIYKTKHVSDSAFHVNPAGSCNLQLPSTPREALNCLNIGFSCHFRCWHDLHLWTGVDLPWIPKSPLPALCGWLSYLRALKVFWTDCILAMGPCSLYCNLWKTCFFTFTKIPKCEKTRLRQKFHQSLVYFCSCDRGFVHCISALHPLLWMSWGGHNTRVKPFHEIAYCPGLSLHPLPKSSSATL